MSWAKEFQTTINWDFNHSQIVRNELLMVLQA
jgi:hypothetical protein